VTNQAMSSEREAMPEFGCFWSPLSGVLTVSAHDWLNHVLGYVTPPDVGMQTIYAGGILERCENRGQHVTLLQVHFWR
jgi:hypothetical protein